MTQSTNETQIGEYRVALDEHGSLRISTSTLTLTFPKEQAQMLIQWLSSQQNAATSPAPVTASPTEPATEAPVTAQNAVEAVQALLDEAIATARANYPASLEIENRDRFIDQFTRDRRIKPYLSQGAVSTKQIILWVEQKLDTGEAHIEELPEKKRRWSLF